MATGLIPHKNSHFDDYRVLEVDFPSYEKYLPLFDLEGTDASPQTHTYLGRQVMFKDGNNLQSPLLQEYIKQVKETVNHHYLQNNINIRVTEYQGGWYIKYERGGYQSMHVHGYDGHGLISTTLSFDGFTYPVFVAKVKTKSGRLKQKEFYDKPGKLRIFNSHDVFHGALPVYSPRRIIVADYRYELLKPM